MVTAAEFWMEQNGVIHITPQGKANPEGAWLGAYLDDVASKGRVVEIGCGPGRLACSFKPELYLGVDINARAIERAKERNMDHRFELITDELPEADAYLLHTVMMHVPDDAIDALIGQMRASVVHVSEMLGREWRREGNPPVFNRDLQDYVRAFGAHGYVLRTYDERIYEHYGRPMALLTFIKSGD